MLADGHEIAAGRVIFLCVAAYSGVLAFAKSSVSRRLVAAVWIADVERIVWITFQVSADLVQIALYFAHAYRLVFDLVFALRRNTGITIPADEPLVEHLVVIASVDEIQIGTVATDVNLMCVQHGCGGFGGIFRVTQFDSGRPSETILQGIR